MQTTPSATADDPLAGVQAGGPPGTIPLVYGHPDPTLLPVGLLAQAAEQAFAETGRLALQYGPEQGYGPLIDYLSDMLTRFVRFDKIYSVRDLHGRPVTEVAALPEGAQARTVCP